MSHLPGPPVTLSRAELRELKDSFDRIRRQMRKLREEHQLAVQRDLLARDIDVQGRAALVAAVASDASVRLVEARLRSEPPLGEQEGPGRP